MSDQWRKRWQEGRIGFHLQQTHPALQRHWGSLGVTDRTKVLVPLCGKSLDMRWLADQGHPVLGIEFAPEAIEQFWRSAAHRYHVTDRQDLLSPARVMLNSGVAIFSLTYSACGRDWCVL